MNENSIILRKKPKLEFKLFDESFEIKDRRNKDNSGVYNYKFTESFIFKEKRINWLVSIASIIVSFFTGGAAGDIYKNKERFILKYKDTYREIDLHNCDMKAAEMVKQKIDLKIKEDYNEEV